MLKLRRFLKYKTAYFQTGILLLLVLGFTFSKTSREKAVASNLPAVDGTSVVILAQASISPIPKVSPRPTPTSTVASPSSSPKVLAASNDELCKNIKDPWYMVADPGKEGVFTICNAVGETMATADELNKEQNQYRIDHGLTVLFINPGLCKIAGERAREISTNFSHNGFQAAIERSGTGKTSFGENIASGPLSALHFIRWSWDRSAGHKANMLGDWTDGCGGVFDKYAVFMFAK